MFWFKNKFKFVTIFHFRQVKGKKSDTLERSFKSENESSSVEDYVYKMPPPKSKAEVGLDEDLKIPSDLPKDVETTMDTTIVSDVSEFNFLFSVYYNIIY